MIVGAPRWSHVALNCRDIDRTEDFYRHWFGFRRGRVIDDGTIRVVFLRRGDAYLELFASSAEPLPTPVADGPTTPGGVRHIAFQVDDLGAFLDAAGDCLTLTLGPLSFDEVIPGWRTAWVADPDGVVVEVSQGYVDEPEPTRAATGNPGGDAR